ncbi:MULTISPECIES: hypothetical protein [Mesorhizobium]|uniref:Uncharacterized protein n=1 Tax=Mesorhizobium robiniae TaxID=559315 RepID=A0ABV2GZB0_9HYPH|nr:MULTISPECIES: hypothetical protein [Mesorhizobium]MCV3211425.1 hypothetical protein [Mesorhizobium sp. YC-2]MCV3233217.1 hypothetical protein [Mesorhizobium sp. YC-39]MCV3242150.1 hypothetical protein [Mesorhizobium sp. ZC-5]
MQLAKLLLKARSLARMFRLLARRPLIVRSRECLHIKIEQVEVVVRSFHDTSQIRTAN